MLRRGLKKPLTCTACGRRDRESPEILPQSRRSGFGPAAKQTLTIERKARPAHIADTQGFFPYNLESHCNSMVFNYSQNTSAPPGRQFPVFELEKSNKTGLRRVPASLVFAVSPHDASRGGDMEPQECLRKNSSHSRCRLRSRGESKFQLLDYILSISPFKKQKRRLHRPKGILIQSALIY